MARRIVGVLVAVVATLSTALLFFLIFSPAFFIPGKYYTRFALALVLLGFSIYLFRRSRRWPSVLLLVGSVALNILEIHEVITWYIFENRLDLITQHPWWWPTCTEDPRIMHALSYPLYPMLCFPIAWFWYSFEATQRHLTKR